jgi:hypothetical protein
MAGSAGRASIVCIAGVVLLSVLVGWTHGNGMYIPEVGIPTPPKIPVQRAMITHRDGVETLVVESTFETKSENVGWILPLPAEPTKLEVGDADMLTSLSFSVRPEVVHDLKDKISGMGFVLLAGVVIGLLVAFRASLLGSGLALACMFLGVSVLLPALGPAGSSVGQIAGVDVSSTHRVGSYAITVLRAADPDALSKWLEAQKLTPLSSSATPIVSDYIARKWCFAVAKLRREGEGLATPHPLVATFPAGKPVFPMRMTSLAEGKTRVELFVVADQRASAEKFHAEATDRYAAVAKEDTGSLERQAHYRAEKTDLVVGHPAAVSLMWNGCILSKLVAELTPEQMSGDVEIAMLAPEPHRDRFYSQQGRRQMTLCILMAGGCLVSITAGLVFRRRRRPDKWGLRVLGCAIALPVLVAGIVYVSVPTIEVRGMRGYHGYLLRSLAYSVLDLREDGRLDDASLPDLPRILREQGRERAVNPVTGEPLRYGRAPGDFSSCTIDGKAYFCVFDNNGVEWRMDLAKVARAVKMGLTPSTGPATMPRESSN